MEPLTIRIDDLLLRSWRPTDAEDIVRARDDAAISHWSNSAPVPFRIADAHALITSNEPTTAGGAIVEAETGRFLGAAILHSIDERARTASLGYWSAPWARGRRATERASRALLSWGFAELGLVRADWRAIVGNQASRLIALRLGFTVVGIVPAELRRRDDTRIDEWAGWLLPEGLTAAGFELPDAVRRTALTFGREQPELDAGVVRLRKPLLKDLPGVLAAHRDPESARWFDVPQPYSDEHGLRYLRDYVPGEWDKAVEAVFAIVDGDDAYAGSIDLRISPTDPAAGEVGCLIAPQARGRGLATAALRAITAWGFAELGLRRIVWRAEVGNDASRRVAEKADFVVEGVRRGSTGPDMWVAARTAGGS